MKRSGEAQVTPEPTPIELRRELEQPLPKTETKPRWWLWLLMLVILGYGGYRLFLKARSEPMATAPAVTKPTTQSVPVVVASARQGDLPVYLTGLGSVTPLNTVTVRSRVDGQLMSVRFQEGQFVRKGDLLAEIDARPYQAQLQQAQGQLARDQALLQQARLDLKRYQLLWSQDSIAKQTVDQQGALVSQYEGIVKLDQGLINAAAVNVTYCQISTPITGRVGLRLIDPGNIVHAADTTGILVITQLQPITVIFTLPEDNLPFVYPKLHAGQQLLVDAYDRASQNKLATGSLLTIDNQIDPTTGTVRLKAQFANDDNTLFPNQFVNARLLVETKRSVILVPNAALQRTSQQTFVYVVKPDHKVTVRQVKIGTTEGGETAIETGLSAGEEVVVKGVDKLREGSVVTVQQNDSNAQQENG